MWILTIIVLLHGQPQELPLERSISHYSESADCRRAGFQIGEDIEDILVSWSCDPEM
jgi:hypothetical protein